jgi:hypothetical protein
MPITTTHVDYDAALGDWLTMRDVLAGSRAVKQGPRSRIYLPPLDGHDLKPELYDRYIRRALFYGATSRTHGGLRGLMERKEPAIEIPDSMATFVADVTGTGVSAAEFAMLVADEVLSVSRCGVLTDVPSAPGGTFEGLVESDIDRDVQRPYWTLYRAEDITNWFVARLSNRWQLVGIVLKQTMSVPADGDEFARQPATSYRLLELERTPVVDDDGRLVGVRFGQYQQRTFVEKAKPKEAAKIVSTTTPSAKTEPLGQDFVEVGGDPVVPQQGVGGKTMDFIPFKFINSRSTSWEVDPKPLLLDLADVNIAHYNNSASYESRLPMTGGQVVVANDKSDQPEDGELTANKSARTWGGQATWNLRGKDAQAYVIQIGPLEPLERALDRKESQMVVLGARVLEGEEDRRAELSGVAKQVDNERDGSSLKTIAKMVSKGLSVSLAHARDWTVNGGLTDVSVTMNTDFFSQPMSPEEIAARVALWQDRIIAKTDLRDSLRDGEVIPDGRADDAIDADLDLEDPTDGRPGNEEDIQPDGEGVNESDG